ncbi:uncharacterized protein KY384_007223 [Bacidia gigantensis]|uniref:uncharacterized protein n=1 Tax=Bacidia gigantensis TaxID=2732470 RepID=UPI001D03CF23|nr:uncharacterized protein KY384_007223 [Bacidia gigantensis]KAG8528306.1 hypothetical protein KY384_007223 [Bacidia gigantensis]
MCLENREIHQTTPDHRVKLTPEGWKQAEACGKKLRGLLSPTDTLHFFTSPYRRTRETTEGILNALTGDEPSPKTPVASSQPSSTSSPFDSPHPAPITSSIPSPFQRPQIKVYEEPRLREQDFGNFQPSSHAMSQMWQERAAYGHFFYRIPNGESAADAYDRISGFNESLWRSFAEETFASVCVLVTHGLMARVFLMKWYHFSVEYFEDLRNVDHCEMVVLKMDKAEGAGGGSGTGKFVLQNELRTWSQLRKERQEEKEAEVQSPESPVPVRKRYYGCDYGDGTSQSGVGFARRQAIRRKNTVEIFADEEGEDGQDQEGKGNVGKPALGKIAENGRHRQTGKPVPELRKPRPPMIDYLSAGRDGGGSKSGANSPAILDGDVVQPQEPKINLPKPGAMEMALRGKLNTVDDEERARADALGDQSDVEENEVDGLQRKEMEVDGSVR